MTSYVLKFNRRSRDLEIETFEGNSGQREALRRRLVLERARSDKDVEIVSLNAASLDAIKRTHSRYFGTSLESSVQQ